MGPGTTVGEERGFRLRSSVQRFALSRNSATYYVRYAYNHADVPRVYGGGSVQAWYRAPWVCMDIVARPCLKAVSKGQGRANGRQTMTRTAARHVAERESEHHDFSLTYPYTVPTSTLHPVRASRYV